MHTLKNTHTHTHTKRCKDSVSSKTRKACENEGVRNNNFFFLKKKRGVACQSQTSSSSWDADDRLVDKVSASVLVTRIGARFQLSANLIKPKSHDEVEHKISGGLESPGD